MTTSWASFTPFALALPELVSSPPAKYPFQSLRTRAIQKFEEIGLPELGEEVFQYFPLRELYEFSPRRGDDNPSIIEQDFVEKHVVPECSKCCLVFIDGCFRVELSMLDALDPKIGVFLFEEAAKTFGHFLQTRLAKQIKEENDPFALLNLALHENGVFIYVPPKLVFPQPIQILHIITQEAVLIAPRVQICVGAQAEVRLHITYAHRHQASLTIATTDIAIEEGARCDTSSVTCGGTQGWHLDYIRASVKREGFFRHTQITKQSMRLRKDIKVDLQGENASCDINGLSLLLNGEVSHTYSIVNHEAPHTVSSQCFKGVLLGRSHSSIAAKIIVQKPAQKTESYQLCKYLLLSELPIANIKPNLEIFADDVKASHGATVSQINSSELFYLQSRGLSIEEAKALLLTSFCEEIKAKLFLASQKEEILSACALMK